LSSSRYEGLFSRIAKVCGASAVMGPCARTEAIRLTRLTLSGVSLSVSIFSDATVGSLGSVLTSAAIRR